MRMIAKDIRFDGAIELRHCVESVKILPPVGENPPDLYGAITSQAVSRPEINAPQRKRSFSLAVTATDERDRASSRWPYRLIKPYVSRMRAILASVPLPDNWTRRPIDTFVLLSHTPNAGPEAR